ncbi:MAG: dUTP diphosphatase [Oscillibacter sp.]|nr:dUTP diphosphatase [Oscillibacter sp.]
MKLQIKPLSDKIGTSIPLPYYATAGAAAVDLHACIDEAVVVPAGGEARVPTGIAAAIPEGYVGIMAVRSSMGIRHGITMSNGIGVIDSDYRGPLSVGLYNLRGEDYVVQPGDRIAQLLVVPVACPEIEVVDTLPETERGEGGFGSTGR